MARACPPSPSSPLVAASGKANTIRYTAGRQALRDVAFLSCGAFLHTIAFSPYEWASAGWLALAPLFIVLQDKPPRKAFLVGLGYAVLWCIGVGSWLHATVATHFPLVFPFDLLFILSNYVFFAGLPTGLVTCLCCVLMRHRSPVLRWGGIPALWVSGEFLRSDLSAGFAWGILGYTQYRHLPLIQVTDLTGVYGLSFLMALSSYVAAEACVAVRNSWKEGRWMHRLPWPALGVLAAGIGLSWLYGTIRISQYQTPAHPSVTIALVQAHVPSEQRWKRLTHARTLLKYEAISRRGIAGTPPDLVVWPEFALNFHLDQEPLLRARLGQFTHGINTPLLVGAPRMGDPAAARPPYNSAYLVAPGGEILDTYDKIRLVPFTERRPLGLPALFEHSRERPNEFTPGQRSTVFSLPQAPFGVLICYEATFPSLARRLVQHGARFLVTISNDTWLTGDEAAVAQHFALAVFRAVETKRALARVATAGLSGFVDPTGRPVQLSAKEEGVSLGQVVPRQEMTVYARYGDWFVWACTSFGLAAGLRAGWQPRSRKHQEAKQ